MSLAFGAAQAPSLDGLFNLGGLVPRGSDEGVFPTLQTRNTSTTANSTVNIFMDSDDSYAFAASVIQACVDQTVYAVQCTSGPRGVGSATCGPNGAVVTVTAAPTLYRVSSAVTATTMGYAVTGTVQETCSLAGTTAATCTATIEATAAGTKSTSSTVATLSGSSYYRFDVAITAGAEKIVNPTATCVAKSAAATVSTKNVMTWALAGIVGVLSMQTMF